MLVSQNEKCVEMYSRVNNFLWNYEEISEKNPQIELPKLELSISIADIYENIIFEKEDENIEL